MVSELMPALRLCRHDRDQRARSGGRARPRGAGRCDSRRRRPGLRRPGGHDRRSRCSRPPSVNTCAPTARSPRWASSPAPCSSQPPASAGPGPATDDGSRSDAVAETPQVAAVVMALAAGAAGLSAWYAALSGNDWLRTVTVGVLMSCALTAALPWGRHAQQRTAAAPAFAAAAAFAAFFEPGDHLMGAVVAVGALAAALTAAITRAMAAGRDQVLTRVDRRRLPGVRGVCDQPADGVERPRLVGGPPRAGDARRALRAITRHRRTRRGAPRPRPTGRDGVVGARQVDRTPWPPRDPRVGHAPAGRRRAPARSPRRARRSCSSP